MAAVIAQRTELSDSTFKTRPSFHAYFQYDTNGKGDAVQQIEKQRRERHMKFPSLTGRKEVDSFKDPQNQSDPAFKRWNDEGDFRPPAPFRACDNIVDPVSGFVSVAGDVDRNTGHRHIKSLVDLNTTPQSRAPQEINSIRVGHSAAPPETQRGSESDAGMPYSWNSKKVLDSTLRASLGGWTSDADPRLSEMDLSAPKDENKILRDKLAHRYTYTSSTQRAYEQVPWDNVLGSRRYPPTSTLEERPDMISQCFSRKRYEPQAEEWQTLGRSWDRFQTRRGYYKTGIPIPGIVFCSPCPRTQHIPLYGGCVGAENLDEIDNAREPFTPFTVKRNPLPWPTDTAHVPNIPRYAGCTWYRTESAPAFTTMPDPKPMTTARVHRPFTVEPNTSPHRRGAIMSRMVTTVPPCNPFTKVTDPGEPIAVAN